MYLSWKGCFLLATLIALFVRFHRALLPFNLLIRFFGRCLTALMVFRGSLFLEYASGGGSTIVFGDFSGGSRITRGSNLILLL